MQVFPWPCGGPLQTPPTCGAGLQVTTGMVGTTDGMSDGSVLHVAWHMLGGGV